MLKNIFLLLVIALSMTKLCYAQFDNYENFMKEREMLAKYSRDQLNSKASKDARKAAKTYKKEGWKAAPGSLPIEKQLDKVFAMQYEYDFETGFPKYIIGQAQSTGENYDAAKMQAINLAKIELAGNIATEINALIKNRVVNNQLSPEQATSGSETIMGAVNRIAQKIGRSIIALELYKELPNKNKEVRVMMFYNSEMAKAAAKDAMREEMMSRAEGLIDQLDSMLGY